MAPTTDGDPSDEIESLWMATTSRSDYPSLTEEVRVDVAVVGGGITGLTTALHLTEAGREVAVLEADRIAEGTSANTTAKLTSQHGLTYRRLCDTVGRTRAKQYADANEAAIDEIESRIDDLGVDADFERTPAYVYAESEADVSELRDEANAARRLGLPADVTESIDAPFEVAGALRFDEQAQFHPRKYLLAVAEAVADAGGHIFEKTPAVGLESGSPCRVETPNASVTADEVVVASHFPFADRAGYFARMHPSRAYLLAVELETSPPNGMYLGSESPAPTFRPHPGERELLIVGGQSHKTGREGPPTSERYRRCEAFAREHFSVDSIRYRWSAHDYCPVDGIPFVGRLGPTTENVYVGVGFNKWGMTGGTAAGMIISDLIVEGENPWAEVFDPLRFSAASGVELLKENATVAGRFVGDRAKTWFGGEGSDSDLPTPGDGAVVRRGGRPIAVHRDETGELHAFSAVCPHMWCLVEWNDAERTWDCPCHGSRFDCDGRVEHGPAKEDLPPRKL